ncbi:hypothetical protein COG02_004555 [Escherichia coli]|nr:hypothetical protein [Escherichia coli]EEX3773787.1 hypothetical protein [Escherichia coli]EFD3793016.1 hypothetical protein [Escherichia coli]EHQ6855374.1 hypothetical protein [Escherichia coli]EIH8664790.1 hypothetical protein [Escherichia coli]
MEFKDLPPSIQEIAAHTLRHRLNELELESVTKKDTDNMNRPGFPGECFICELRLPDHRF